MTLYTSLGNTIGTAEAIQPRAPSRRLARRDGHASTARARIVRIVRQRVPARRRPVTVGGGARRLRRGGAYPRVLANAWHTLGADPPPPGGEYRGAALIGTRVPYSTDLAHGIWRGRTLCPPEMDGSDARSSATAIERVTGGPADAAPQRPLNWQRGASRWPAQAGVARRGHTPALRWRMLSSRIGTHHRSTSVRARWDWQPSPGWRSPPDAVWCSSDQPSAAARRTPRLPPRPGDHPAARATRRHPERRRDGTLAQGAHRHVRQRHRTTTADAIRVCRWLPRRRESAGPIRGGQPHRGLPHRRSRPLTRRDRARRSRVRCIRRIDRALRGAGHLARFLRSRATSAPLWSQRRRRCAGRWPDTRAGLRAPVSNTRSTSGNRHVSGRAADLRSGWQGRRQLGR